MNAYSRPAPHTLKGNYVCAVLLWEIMTITKASDMHANHTDANAPTLKGLSRSLSHTHAHVHAKG